MYPLRCRREKGRERERFVAALCHGSVITKRYGKEREREDGKSEKGQRERRLSFEGKRSCRVLREDPEDDDTDTYTYLIPMDVVFLST